MPSNIKAQNKKHILPDNLGGKHSLVMKFGQFIYAILHRNIFIEKVYKKYDLQISSKSFIFIKN